MFLSPLSCLDEESFGLEDQLWKAVIEGVGNYLIVCGLCLCSSVIVNTGTFTLSHDGREMALAESGL
jgi:hypothetical protein